MVHTIENSLLCVGVEENGAQLRFITGKRDGHSYMWSGDPAVWNATSPLLFPFVGGLRNDRYRLDGAVYPMEKHGFARHMAFECAEKNQDSLALVCRDTEETRACYPFRFELEVRFRLAGNRLSVAHRVRNAGGNAMYFSIGAHPGFACCPGDYLEFEKPETADAWRMNEDKLLRSEREPFLCGGRVWPIREDSFDGDAWILESLHSGYAALKSHSHGRAVTVEFGGAPYVGIWAKPNAHFVCIEPWFGIDDSACFDGEVGEKKGIQTLPRGGDFVFEYGIVIQSDIAT